MMLPVVKTAATILLVAMLGACGQSTQDAEPATSVTQQDPVPEATVTPAQLMLTPPKGWTQVHQQNHEGSRQVRYQHPSELDQFLIVESCKHNADTDQADPLRQMDVLEANSEAQCPDLRSYPTFAAEERGFPTVVRLLICPPTPEANGRINLLKLMVGPMDSYLVAFEKNWSPITAAEDFEGVAQDQDPAIALWSLYLRNVYLCQDNCDPGPESKPR